MLTRRRGLSLIELMVTITVLALILLAAVPRFGTMVANARVRSAAESMQNAVRLAQAAAVQRNRQVVLLLTNDSPSMAAVPAANGVNWVARALPLLTASKSVDSADLYIQGGALTVSGSVTVTGPAQTCFNSLGRQDSNTGSYTGSVATANFTAACGVSTTGTKFDLKSDFADRQLRVTLQFGGKLRLCTPDATTARLIEGCV